eukprot:1076452-Rhodomonas_salina.1
MTSKYNEWYKITWKSPKPELEKALNHEWYPASSSITSAIRSMEFALTIVIDCETATNLMYFCTDIFSQLIERHVLTRAEQGIVLANSACVNLQFLQPGTFSANEFVSEAAGELHLGPLSAAS